MSQTGNGPIAIYSAFNPSGGGKYKAASAGMAEAGMIHFVRR